MRSASATRPSRRAFPTLKRADSPSERVGAAPRASSPPSAMRVPMLSLENAYTDDDVRDFVAQMHRFLGRAGRRADRAHRRAQDRRPVDVAALRGGQAVLGATRGDGVTGEDVTANVRTISDIPHDLPKGAPELVEVRGEIYLGKEDFAALNGAAGGGGRAALRQCAQHRRRLAAPEGPEGHRVAAAALLRLCLGRDQRAARRHPVRHGRALRANGAFRSIR